MSAELLDVAPCAKCGNHGEQTVYELSGGLCVSYYFCRLGHDHTGLWRTYGEARKAWNRSQSLKREHTDLKEAWAVVVEELGLTSEFASDADHGKICDALRELNALAAETLSARDDALRHEGRADYFAALLTRLLATRQGRTVGYEPPDVQQLWRKIESAVRSITDEKVGEK